MADIVPTKNKKHNILDNLEGHAIAVHGLRDGACTCRKRGDCPSKGKHPVAKNWVREDVTISMHHQKLIKLGEMNIGWAVGGRLFVIDCDGEVGLESLRKWETLGLVDGTTGLRTATGSGGVHVWVTAPDDWAGPLPSNSAKSVAPGIDVRGVGGMVVLPPSLHASGGVYKWDMSRERGDSPQVATDALMRVVCPGKHKTSGDSETLETYESDAPIDTVAALELLNSVPDGECDGDTVAYKLACTLSELGLSEPVIARLMFQSKWNERCSPPWALGELLEKAHNATVYKRGVSGAKSATRTAIEAVEVDGGAVSVNAKTLRDGSGVLVGDWVKDVNKIYGLIIIGGQARIARRGADGAVEFLHPQAFAQLTSGIYVEKVRGGKMARIRMAKAWADCDDGDRRIWRGVGIWPRDDAPSGYLNTWPGLPRWEVSEGGSCDRFLEHLRVRVCGGSEEVYEWTLDWLAHMVQSPWEVPGVALLLGSEREGVGKGVFAEYVSRMIGSRLAVRTNDSQLICGTFNGLIEGRLLVVAEEAFFRGNHADADRLKSIITDKTISIHRKGLDAYDQTNIMRLICTTNRSDSVTIGVQGSRRWQFYRMDGADQCLRGAELGDYLGEMDGDGPAALGAMLRDRVVTHNIHEPVKGGAYDEARMESLAGIVGWLHDQLEDDMQGVVPNCLRAEDCAAAGDREGAELDADGRCVDYLRVRGEDRLIGLWKKGEGLFLHFPTVFEKYRMDTGDRYATARKFSAEMLKYAGGTRGVKKFGGRLIRGHEMGGIAEMKAKFSNITGLSWA